MHSPPHDASSRGAQGVRMYKMSPAAGSRYEAHACMHGKGNSARTTSVHVKSVIIYTAGKQGGNVLL